MRGLKIPLQDFALKVQGGGLMCEGGVYLRDTMVHVCYTHRSFCHFVIMYVVTVATLIVRKKLANCVNGI